MPARDDATPPAGACVDRSGDLLARFGWRLSVVPGRPGDLAPGARRWSDPRGGLHVSGVPGDPDLLVLGFLDLVGARISRRARTVRVFAPGPDLPRSSLEHFVLDLVLPRLIAEDGALVVHGALVARGADAVCLVGESGRGKSTLSAALRNAGWTFHGDDALVLRAGETGITAQATYPSLRLFPDSLEQLFPAPPAGLAPVADYLEKFRLDPGGSAAPAGPCRLRAVLVLGEDDGSGAVALHPLTASRLCMTLVGQGFALDPMNPQAAHRRLSAAGEVVALVPGAELRYPRDYHRLPEVTGRIGGFLDRLRAGGPGTGPGPAPLGGMT